MVCCSGWVYASLNISVQYWTVFLGKKWGNKRNWQMEGYNKYIFKKHEIQLIIKKIPKSQKCHLKSKTSVKFCTPKLNNMQ